MLYLNHYDIDLRLPTARLREDGWDGLRRNVRTLAEAITVCMQHQSVGLGALHLLDEPATADTVRLATSISGLSSVTAIEVGNEWDIKDVDPELARELWLACRTRMNPKVTLVTGGISNVSDESWTWLARASRDLPAEIVLGIHGYGSDPWDDQDRYKKFHGRTYWNTETGWDRGPHPRDFPLCFLNKRRSEQEQADCFSSDALLARGMGLGMYCAYQVADGLKDTPADRHGLYREDGSARPAVPALISAWKGAAS